MKPQFWLCEGTLQRSLRCPLQRLGGPLILAIALTLGTAPQALAQALPPAVRFPFLADPLQDDLLDPLLPRPTVSRPPSPLELYALEQALDQLALEAEALAGAGELEQARDIWRREIRLRRLLGVEPELAAINRVGQWLRDSTATQDLQLYAVRLDEIRADLVLPEDRERLERLAETYVVLGAIDAAADIRRDLADAARLADNTADYRRQLEILAALRSEWFYFPAAAEAYGELVALNQVEANPDDERRYLTLEAENLEQAQDFAGAIALQQRLLTLYQSDESLWPEIAPLQQRVAQNYLALGDVATAARQFQVAYTNAIDLEQFEIAANAINDLANVYKSLGRWADVGYLYEQLLVVAQQSHSAFTMMAAYDELGQVHEQLGATPSALAAYREGLVLARVLGTRQAYFEAQIARLTKDAT
ncbi:hypothetical protein ACQ4N7_02140 [Nodosilinea sp. AN01ver1]|uniref:hypothetical protein n=1 Tax=Nodosilinea sp. AN01ver1 TaxID=3423362 RepID=UPI003D313CB5